MRRAVRLAVASRTRLESADVTEQRRRQRTDAAARMLNHVVALVVWTAVTIVVFHLFDIDAAFFLSSAGFIGAAVAIGGQHKVNDYLTGLSVLFEDRYGIGDELVVEVPGRDPLHAVVDHIGLVTTRLRDERSTLHVPNAQLVVVRNLSQEAVASTVRLRLPDGAGADLERSAADALRSVAGTDQLTDVVFVGDLAARQHTGRQRRRGDAHWAPARRAGPVAPRRARRAGAPGLAGVAGAGGALATDDATLLLGEPTPDPGVLVRVQGEVEALDPDGALVAHLFGPLDLGERRPGRADREEQFGIGVPAQCVVAPGGVGRAQGEA